MLPEAKQCVGQLAGIAIWITTVAYPKSDSWVNKYDYVINNFYHFLDKLVEPYFEMSLSDTYVVPH